MARHRANIHDINEARRGYVGQDNPPPSNAGPPAPVYVQEKTRLRDVFLIATVTGLGAAFATWMITRAKKASENKNSELSALEGERSALLGGNPVAANPYPMMPPQNHYYGAAMPPPAYYPPSSTPMHAAPQVVMIPVPTAPPRMLAPRRRPPADEWAREDYSYDDDDGGSDY